jgi:glutamate dehydrogenase
MRLSDDPTDEGGCEGAIRYFEQGGQEPLLAKADLRSPVHRRVPLDLIVVPLREGKKITGIGVHAGLWTSQALTAPIEEVPLLRRQLAKLEEEFGFDPSGHSGKALRHALSSLAARPARQSPPAGGEASGRHRDHPRRPAAPDPDPGPLDPQGPHVRLRLAAARRAHHAPPVSIGEMIEQAAKGRITNWSVDLGDGDLALVRYTLNVARRRRRPTPRRSTASSTLMVRGWEPAVEEALGESCRAGAGDAADDDLRFDAFPPSFRTRYPAADAAEDILRLDGLADDRRRSTRLYQPTSDPENRLRLKSLSQGALVPLVRRGAGAREFRLPRARGDADPLDEGRARAISTNSSSSPRSGPAAPSWRGPS